MEGADKKHDGVSSSARIKRAVGQGGPLRETVSELGLEGSSQFHEDDGAGLNAAHATDSVLKFKNIYTAWPAGLSG